MTSDRILKNKVILVVDDEPDIRALVQEILVDEEYDVATAENGAAARRALRDRRQALEERERMLARREAALAQVEEQLLGRAEHALEDHRYHAVAQLAIDRLVFIPFGIHE
mgnify:CR=1 FL=1